MKQKISNLYLDIATSSFSSTATDFIKSILILVIGFAILLTIVFLFFSIVSVTREKEDQEERANKIKHSIIVGVCLMIEIVVAVLLISLL